MGGKAATTCCRAREADGGAHTSKLPDSRRSSAKAPTLSVVITRSIFPSPHRILPRPARVRSGRATSPRACSQGAASIRVPLLKKRLNGWAERRRNS
ncbi:hypothetical protein D3C81_1780330 [compost metagenome]